MTNVVKLDDWRTKFGVHPIEGFPIIDGETSTQYFDRVEGELAQLLCHDCYELRSFRRGAQNALLVGPCDHCRDRYRKSDRFSYGVIALVVLFFVIIPALRYAVSVY